MLNIWKTCHTFIQLFIFIWSFQTKPLIWDTSLGFPWFLVRQVDVNDQIVMLPQDPASPVIIRPNQSCFQARYYGINHIKSYKAPTTQINICILALGLSHINWAKVTSTPWQGDLEESHINGRKSHQYVRITMAQLQKEDASKRPKSQKTLRTLAHQPNFSLISNVCRWQITMAHWFQTSSAQRKQITSICQNYNGTAAEGRCFQKAKITENTARTGTSV